MKAEYRMDYLQRDGVERKDYVGGPSFEARERREGDGVGFDRFCIFFITICMGENRFYFKGCGILFKTRKTTWLKLLALMRY